jgi:hypothetical protein
MNLVWSRIRGTVKLKAACRVALRLLRYDGWFVSSLVLAPADQLKLTSFVEVREKLRSGRPSTENCMMQMAGCMQGLGVQRENVRRSPRPAPHPTLSKLPCTQDPVES